MAFTMLGVGCFSDHGGVIITGDPTMTIDGKPAARIGDLHSCPESYPDGSPHSVTPIQMAVSCPERPMINGIPAALSTDLTGCGATLLPCSGSAIVRC